MGVVTRSSERPHSRHSQLSLHVSLSSLFLSLSVFLYFYEVSLSICALGFYKALSLSLSRVLSLSLSSAKSNGSPLLTSIIWGFSLQKKLVFFILEFFNLLLFGFLCSVDSGVFVEEPLLFMLIHKIPCNFFSLSEEKPNAEKFWS